MTYATSVVQIQSSDGMYMLGQICKAKPHTRVQINVIRSIQPKALLVIQLYFITKMSKNYKAANENCHSDNFVVPIIDYVFFC